VLHIRSILVAIAALLAVFAVAASDAMAVNAPFYATGSGGTRLAKGNTREVTLKAEGNQVLENKTTKITITCTGVAASAKSLVVGSEVGEPGTSEGKIEYSGCTVSGNGTGCAVAGKAVTTNALKDELAYEKKEATLTKGNKLVDYFKPASGAAFAPVTFEGGECIDKSTTVEGSVNVEILNSKKEAVAVGEHEATEEFSFIKVFTGEACKVAKGAFTECVKPSTKAFGTVSNLEGTAKVEIAKSEVFGATCGCGITEPLPNETTITGFGKTTEGSKEVPVVNWSKESPITTKGCKGGKVVISVEAENTETKKFEHREATLTESPAGSGKFSGDIPVMKPLHGKATVKITVSGCEHSSEDIVVEIKIYIDPSGTVVDGNHEDAPLWEATVTLLTSATETGTYTAVENGSEVMSPMNRVNPDKTRENGAFGWEVIEGFYKVEASKTGCGTATTPAFHVPPAVENLEIVLHCEGEQWKLGEEGGEKAQLAVKAPAKKCEGTVRVENVSFGAAVIAILKETGTECTIKKGGCEGKKLNQAEKCESELEKPGTKPEYEIEVEWKGKKFSRKFPV
jgi:hypothetical protein